MDNRLSILLRYLAYSVRVKQRNCRLANSQVSQLEKSLCACVLEEDVMNFDLSAAAAVVVAAPLH